MSHWTDGRLENRESVGLECRNCVKAQLGGENCAGAKCTRNEDGIIFMRKKYGKVTRNMQKMVSMGDIGNLARDFPKNAPRVPKQHHTKGSRGSTNDCAMRSHGSRKFREVSVPGRRWKVVKALCPHGGFGGGGNGIFGVAGTRRGMWRSFQDEDKYFL